MSDTPTVIVPTGGSYNQYGDYEFTDKNTKKAWKIGAKRKDAEKLAEFFQRADGMACKCSIGIFAKDGKSYPFISNDPFPELYKGEGAVKPVTLAPQADEPTKKELELPPLPKDPKNASIEAQVAAYCARDIMVAQINKSPQGESLRYVVDWTTTLQAFILATMQGNFREDFDMAKFLVSKEE